MGIIRDTPDALDCEPQGSYVSRRKLKKVSGILSDGEKLHYVAKGGGITTGNVGVEDADTESAGTRGFVWTAITDRRVAVKIPQWLGSDQRSIPFESITSIDLDRGLVTKELKIQTPGPSYGIKIGKPGKGEMRDAVEFINSRIAAGGQPSGKVGSDPDPLDRLSKLEDLREDGVLSESEYEEKRQSLLDDV